VRAAAALLADPWRWARRPAEAQALAEPGPERAREPVPAQRPLKQRRRAQPALERGF